MAQGEHTKEECSRVKGLVLEMYKALPKAKVTKFAGHALDIESFLDITEKVLPKASDR